jgi:hypothetical protein
LKVGVKDPGATNRNEPGTDPFDTQNITIGVGDQALTGQAAPFNAVEGAPVNAVVVATFIDADPNAQAADFTATVNWGEGDLNIPPAPLTQGTITKGSNGVFTITASKPSAYREAGIFSVKTSIVDKLGATASVSSSAVVADAALSLGVGIPSGLQGAPATFLVATATDLNPLAKATDFNATIDWGDGQVTTGTVLATSGQHFLIIGTHTYASSGSFTMHVTVNDAVPAGDVPGSTVTAAGIAHIAPSVIVLPPVIIPPPPLPPVIGDAGGLFVATLYQDLLGRLPEQAGFSFFSTAIDQGRASRFQVVVAIESSLEYRTRVVEGLYDQLLHRSADPSGLAASILFLNSGGTLDGLRLFVAGSDEYFALHGGAGDKLVTALYEDLLGRAPDAMGLQAWVSALNSGVARALVAQSLLSSVEGAQHEVQVLYVGLLHRSADPGGLAAFSGALRNGLSSEQIEALIAASDEYAATRGSPFL